MIEDATDIVCDTGPIIGSIPSRSTLFIKAVLLKEIAVRIKKEFNI